MHGPFPVSELGNVSFSCDPEYVGESCFNNLLMRDEHRMKQIEEMRREQIRLHIHTHLQISNLYHYETCPAPQTR